jgi:hypothetical protein
MIRLMAAIGLIAGLGLGLWYAWIISPVQYTDTAPISLRADYKTDYIRLVAVAYLADGDVERARTRLAALNDPNPEKTVTALAQRAAASGGDPQIVRALAALALALGAGPVGSTPVAATTPSVAPAGDTPTPTATTEPSPTSLPTLTPQVLPTQPPSPTPPGFFVYVGQQPVCDPTLVPPLLQVMTQDNAGNPVPGVEVLVEWTGGGFDRFFTGLKPELGEGYGDLAMQTDTVYTVRLASSPDAQIENLRSEPCQDEEGKTYPGSVRLLFRQP